MKNCTECNKLYKARVKQIFCSRRCFMIYRGRINHIPIEERFFENIDKTDYCWLWTGSKYGNGYGRIFIKDGSKYKKLMAHRFSYLLHKGQIPDGMLVCHSCDNPSCVNPDHLWLGTNKDNMIDRDSKNRNVKGENTWTAKLTEDEVRIIKSRFEKGESCTVLAKEYDMHQATMNAIKHNKTWKHVV